ncbi:MAG: T9SS type A sorting domain-containing protein, partial [Bacteroidia bacterium]
TSTFAQNLVPNFSFEDTVQCPPGAANIQDAAGWYSAGLSPDYYNSCASLGGYINGVPDNWTGHHNAYSGNAYSGLITYHVYLQQGSREDIGVQLTQSLSVGTKYFVSAYILRGDTIFYQDTLKCACNKFGFRFSTTQYFPWPTDNFSNVHSDSIITDAVNWTRIAGSFVADSAYQYLIIGNFYDDAHTDTAQCSGGYAYYLIDMVCVSTDSANCVGNVGMQENQKPALNIFPNPVRDVLNIQHSSVENQYAIIDATGKIIMEGELEKQSTQLNISSISNGIYFLQLNKIKSYKIIIIH